MIVVVAYSPDQYGEAALEAGIDQVRTAGGRLVVVNATRGDALVDRRFADSAQVDDLSRRLEDAGVEHQVRQSVVTDVATAVVETANAESADLIVVGVRHRSPVGKAIMGSVAQQVILDAVVPVLSVKPSK